MAASLDDDVSRALVKKREAASFERSRAASTLPLPSSELVSGKGSQSHFPFFREMSTDTAAATENDFAMEMLDQCRFYVEGVALLPVSIIGIIGN